MIFGKLISKKNNFKIFPLYFISLSFINFVLSFLNPPNLKDFDHELYFGVRMLSGDLIYISEIHDKLPFVPTILTIPGFFKSERPWILISAILIFISSFYFFKSFTRLFLLDWRLKSKNIVLNFTLIAASLIPYSISVLSGGLLEINAIAAPSILLSTCLLLNYSSYKNNNFLSTKFWGSAFFAAVGISIRPYYLFSIFILSIWTMGRKIIINRQKYNISLNNNLKTIIKLAFFWLSFVFLFGLLLNIVPYVLTGNFDSFINGLQHIAQETHQQSLGVIFKSQYVYVVNSSIVASLVPISIFIGIYVIFYNFYNKKISCLENIKSIDLICGSFLSMIFLQLLIFSKHFWSHYYQLMLPYAIISLLFSLIYIVDSNKLNVYNINFTKSFNSLISILLICALFRTDIYKTLRNVQNLGSPSQSQIIFNEVKEYLDKTKIKGTKSEFLFPRNMVPHWKLNQYRYGFPSSAHINHILNNKWDKLDKKLNLRMPINSTKYCKDLIYYGPNTIFTYKNSFESDCLKKTDNFYLLDRKSKYLSIFIRQLD